MIVNTYTEKLNKIDGKVYVIEEAVHPVNGVYEAELQHDNINIDTLSVYTGPKLTGDHIEDYALSTPSLTPWKRIIRIYSGADTVYITYETDGDTVEAEDINCVQAGIVDTQTALNQESDRAQAVENEITRSLIEEVSRATARELELEANLQEEGNRAQMAEQQLRQDLTAEQIRAQAAEGAIETALHEESSRAEAAEKANADAIAAETERASGVETTLTAGLSAEIQRAKAAEKANADAISAEAGRAAAAESAIVSAIQANQPIWEDKYTRNEIDNKFSTLETAIDWKESVGTFANIAATYPDPKDGWTVNVRDTDYTYRWSGTEWVAISANAIPKATQAVDGLLSKEDKTNYDDASAKKHSHNNKAVLDGVTSSLVTAWNSASEHTAEKTNPHQVTYTQAGAAPANHASSSDIYGRASAVNYGHVKLSDVTDSTSGTGAATAATPLAVKKVYDELANSKADTGHMHTNMNCINLSGQTVDVDSYTLSSGTPHFQRYTVLTSAGAANIAHIPVTGQPFLLTAELIRFASPNDYVTKQTFVTNAQKSTYTRWCTSGTWSNWLPDARFSDSPVNGQVLVAGSAGGTVKPSGFTLGASVPAGAKFTDTVYTHPSTAGNKHIPSGGSSGQILRWSADGTAAWGTDSNTTYTDFKGATASGAGSSGLVPAPAMGTQSSKYLRADGTWQTPPNTTYNVATGSANGLMSSADKSKLDGIATGAQVNTITGIKGNAETAYRTGNVNLTPANIGAAASNHTHNYAATSHTHNYAGSSSAGGVATKALQDSDGNQFNTTYVKKGCTWNDIKGV